MPAREATARIKINRLLEAAGWCFFSEGALPANIPGLLADLRFRPHKTTTRRPKRSATWHWRASAEMKTSAAQASAAPR